jgi:hypothetical protein
LYQLNQYSLFLFIPCPMNGLLTNHFESFTVATIDRYGISVSKWNIFLYFPHSWLINGFVTRLTRRVPLVEKELPTLPGHLSSPPVFSGVRVTWSLMLCVCFVDRCLSFCSYSFSGYYEDMVVVVLLPSIRINRVYCPFTSLLSNVPLGYNSHATRISKL